jgi:hypothetical protein
MIRNNEDWIIGDMLTGQYQEDVMMKGVQPVNKQNTKLVLSNETRNMLGLELLRSQSIGDSIVMDMEGN